MIHMLIMRKNISKRKKLKNFLENFLLIISARLNNQTKFIINSSSIKFLKKGAKIINISRGELVEKKQFCIKFEKKNWFLLYRCSQ